TGIKDLAGNPMSADYVWSFTTEPDITPPTVISTNPLNNAIDVDINTVITATFSEPMDETTMNTSTFTIDGVTGTVSYDPASKTATYTPSAILNYATTYTATVIKDVKDLAGNPMPSDFVWSFTTAPAPDITPPAIVSTNPLDGENNVAISTSVSATFSEAMDASTINDSTFTISNGATGTVGYDDTTKTATFTPSSNLSYFTTYTATITTGIKDLAGNPMSADYVWSFTTGAMPDITPPAVVSAIPTDGTADVPINSTITATFSEVMDATTIDTNTFTLSGGVTGTISYDSTTNTATLTPSSSLSYSTSYTATITTGVKDLAGNAMTADYSWGFTTTASSPASPTTLTAKAISPSGIILTWQDRSGTEMGFKIERKMGVCSSSSDWSDIATVEANVRTYTDTGLSPHTRYSYRVKAYNAGGDSAYSLCNAATTGLSDTPNAPTNLKAVSISENKVNLSWTDNSTDETEFHVYRKIGTGAWVLLAKRGENVTIFHDTTATGNTSTTTYSYYVTACNNSGCSPGTNSAVVPFRPSAPTADAFSSSQINLSWTSVKATGFQIQRMTGDCASVNYWKRIAMVGGKAINYNNTGLSSETTYSYKLRAYSRSNEQPYAYGYSLWSDCDDATTPGL
ncbi:MAG TPA: Ig-like domain-containing protein, partial [Candidatus Brocadiaceae bacterium]